MFETLLALQQRGYFVEARQIDDDDKALGPTPIAVVHASKGELKQKEISSVPLLLIGDLKKKVVYRMTGYQPFETVTEVLSQRGS